MPAELDLSLLEPLRNTLELVAVFSQALRLDAAVDMPSGLVAALRRTRPEVEKLLVANDVPPVDAYELLFAALGMVSESLEGARLDRCLVQEVRKLLVVRRERERVWAENRKAWVDLLVQACIVPQADRSTWLRTLGAQR